jgi:hypothetical protein
MSMKWTILSILSASLALGSCRSSSGRDMELLTNSPWIYEKAAFNTDDEEDVHFDALDPRIMGFVKDYTVVFRQDGTGALRESNTNGKHHRIDSFPFIWSFQNKDSLLYFQDQYYRVQTLTNDHLIIYADHKVKGVHSRYTIVLKH